MTSFETLRIAKLTTLRGFKICRVLALNHPESCIAIHTVNPDVPAPRFAISPLLWVKYRIAKLTFAILRRSTFGYSPEELVLPSPGVPDPMQMTPGLTPPLTPGIHQAATDRPQTAAYALCDSPSGLLAYILDSIRPPSIRSNTPSPAHSRGSPENLRQPSAGRSPISPQSYETPQIGPSPRSPGASQILELGDISSPWTQTAVINWAMLYWLPGPEVALRWLTNSVSLVPSLWASHSSVPLAISHFQEQTIPGTPNMQNPPQWAEAYHRIAMVRRRDGGRVRFPAWERPAEIVMDIREFADLLGTVSSGPSVSRGM